MIENFKIIPFACYSGLKNMTYDEELLNSSIEIGEKSPIFRLYGWQPACVSLGRNQDDKFLDKTFLKSIGVDVVKRLTGGRALFHDKEITYSFVCPQSYLKNGDSVIGSYKEISEILIKVFDLMGISLNLGGGNVHTKYDYCMLVSTGADLNYNGKKLIGSAQCRKSSYILQQGSILFDYDKLLIEKIFGEKIDTELFTTIREILPYTSIEQFCEHLQTHIRDVFCNREYLSSV